MDTFINNKHPDEMLHNATFHLGLIAPDKDWKQLGIYPLLFGLIGYFKF